MSDWHITPIDDTYAHEESATCWCKPAESIVEADSIFTHNSHDRREDYEAGDRAKH